MIPLPADIQSRDISQWIGRGWFVVARKKKDDVLARLSEIGEENILYVQMLQGPDEELRNLRYRPTSVRCHWPLLGSINMPQGIALYVQRVAMVQYRRTYDPQQVRVSVPGRFHLMTRMGVQAARVRTDASRPALVWRLFYPEYPSLDEAIDGMDRGELNSVAVSPHIILLRGQDQEVYFVYYHGEFAATLDHGRLMGSADPNLPARLNKLLGGRFIT